MFFLSINILMKNIFIQKLQFDFCVSTSFIEDLTPRIKRPDMCFYTSKYSADITLTTFLRTLNLMVKRVDIVRVAPNTYAGELDGVGIHHDGGRRYLENGEWKSGRECKLIWTFGAPTPRMIWYKEIDNAKYKPLSNSGFNGGDLTTGAITPKEFCVPIHSAILDGLSLVNVEFLHAADNPDNVEHWYASYSLGDLTTKEFIPWEEACERLKSYFI